MSDQHLQKELFERANTMLRVQGIITIVFGSLGTLFGLLLMVGFGYQTSLGYANVVEGEAIGASIFAIICFIFFVVPHMFLIVSGVNLIGKPEPKIAKTLTIINLVLGVFWNLIILVFAIISLTQSSDYERYYKKAIKE